MCFEISFRLLATLCGHTATDRLSAAPECQEPATGLFKAGQGLSPGQLRPAAPRWKDAGHAHCHAPGPDGHLPHHTLFMLL